MAKIVVLNTNKDYEIAEKIKNKLQKLSYLVIVSSSLKIDLFNIEHYTDDLYKDADGLIIILNKNANESKFLRNEIALAFGYFRNMKNKFILPVITDELELPEYLSNTIALRLQSNDIDNAVDSISNSVLNLLGKNKAEQVKKKDELKRISDNGEEYIKKTLEVLQDRENKNRIIATICYIVGYVTLFSGVIFSLRYFERGDLQSLNLQWYQYMYLTTRALAVFIFLAACTKYVFSLGKAYMNESLKNADRGHAISFGRFYLRTYGDKATWEELKEVFQYWNLDKNSYFASLNTKEFDPQVTNNLLESLLKNVSDIKK